MLHKALDFLHNHSEVAFATSEDGKPKIRIFQIMKQDDTTLYFATSPEKEVYRQLQANPAVFKHFDLTNGTTGDGYVGERYSKKL